jgi:Ca-activated chloride channel family protein
MSFAWPHLLFLLVLPVLLLTWELRRRRQHGLTLHPKILQAEAGQNRLRLQGRGATAATRARLWLCLGLAFAIVALARPQWGRLEEPVFDQSREILIAVDLSRSMLAQDVKPSRLDRAKLLINSLLEKLAGERVGLAVFSGTAFLQSPLSADYEILREFLPALGPDYLPEGGTNYHALLETAVQAFGTSTAADRFLIVLSDGEATDDDWQDLVSALKKKNIRAICLGIGTGAGAMIPDGSGGFVKDDRGAVVLSKLDSSTLQKLARETDGVYRDASSWVDLAAVLQKTVEAGRKGKFVDKKNVRHVERYQWALAPALLCLLLSFWLEFPVRPRPRALKLSAAGPGTLAAGLLVLGFALAGPPPLRAAATAVPPPATASTSPEKPGLTPLGKIVSRLSAQPAQSGRDWAELARQTVTWGQKLKTDHQPVPSGPVNDALAAVAIGEKLDAKTADWGQLRQELKALLETPAQPPSQRQNQDQSKDQNDRQQKSDQDQSRQDHSKSSPDQKNQPRQNQPKPGGAANQPQSGGHADQRPPQDRRDQSTQPLPSSPSQNSAFGDMKQKTPPPSPARGEMQKVGGAPHEKTPSPGQLDPALAMPLQKMQKIREGDSPAQLFQMMEGKPEPSPSKTGKNW